jgi:hypothetical protein
MGVSGRFGQRGGIVDTKQGDPASDTLRAPDDRGGFCAQPIRGLAPYQTTASAGLAPSEGPCCGRALPRRTVCMKYGTSAQVCSGQAMKNGREG